MKTINLLIILLLTAVMVYPQHRLMQVYSEGEVAYEINTAQVDSVVFRLLKEINSNENKRGENEIKGKIVGYLKCAEYVKGKKTDNILFGLYIVTESKENLLSFDIDPSLFNLNIEELQGGVYGFIVNNSLISFTYRNVEENEFRCFDCPPSLDMFPGLMIPMENFMQVIISNIKIIR